MCTHSESVAIRMSNVTLTNVPRHVRWWPRRRYAELQREFVDGINFRRRLQPPTHPCAARLVVPRFARHWSTASPLPILTQEDFGFAASDAAEGRGITPIPRLVPTKLFKPGKAFRHVRSEEHTSELQSQSNLVCRLL